MGVGRRALLKIWKHLPLKKLYERRVLRLIAPTFTVGLVGIVNDEAGRVLLARHTYRRRRPWGLPAGLLEANEQIFDCIAREIREETALVAAPVELVGVDVLTHRRIVECVVRLRIVAGEFEPSDEVSEARFFAADELPELSDEQIAFIERHREQLFVPAAPSREPKESGDQDA